MKPKSKAEDRKTFTEYETTIEYECPVRGKVSQVVKVKKYRYTGSPEIPMRW